MTNSTDKRTVHTDALDTLGTILEIGQGHRDAIHLAVEPIVAAERLYPGQDVGLSWDMKASTKADKMLGIVDPFLKEPVMPGEMFWLVVYPRQITSLRHVWEHPDFDKFVIERKVDSRFVDTPIIKDHLKALKYITKIAHKCETEYEDFMTDLKNYVATGQSICSGPMDMYADDMLWDAYETITGEIVPVHRREEREIFYCSC